MDFRLSECRLVVSNIMVNTGTGTGTSATLRGWKRASRPHLPQEARKITTPLVVEEWVAALRHQSFARV